MARSTSSIQAEIDAIEASLSTSASTLSSVGSDGTNASRDRAGLERRLDQLYQQLDRTNGNAPMFVRGRIKGF